MPLGISKLNPISRLASQERVTVKSRVASYIVHEKNKNFTNNNDIAILNKYKLLLDSRK